MVGEARTGGNVFVGGFAFEPGFSGHGIAGIEFHLTVGNPAGLPEFAHVHADFVYRAGTLCGYVEAQAVGELIFEALPGNCNIRLGERGRSRRREQNCHGGSGDEH